MVFPTDEAIAENNKRMAALTGYKPAPATPAKPEKKKLAKVIPLFRMPTDLCRTTFFLPLPRKGRAALQKEMTEKVFESNPWGMITFNGRLLSVDDQDILLAVLFIVKMQQSLSIETTFVDIQLAMGREKAYSKNNVKIRESLERLAAATIKIDFPTADFWAVGGILEVTHNKGKININISQNFYDRFLASYTEIPVSFRMKLKSDISKLLHIFLSSHRNPKQYKIGTLVDVLNLNKKLEHKYLKRQIQSALNELKSNGFLDFKMKKDIIHLAVITSNKRKELE